MEEVAWKHKQPYINGKRNRDYSNPILKSSAIFYVGDDEDTEHIQNQNTSRSRYPTNYSPLNGYGEMTPRTGRYNREKSSGKKSFKRNRRSPKPELPRDSDIYNPPSFRENRELTPSRSR